MFVAIAPGGPALADMRMVPLEVEPDLAAPGARPSGSAPTQELVDQWEDQLSKEIAMNTNKTALEDEAGCREEGNGDEQT